MVVALVAVEGCLDDDDVCVGGGEGFDGAAMALLCSWVLGAFGREESVCVALKLLLAWYEDDVAVLADDGRSAHLRLWWVSCCRLAGLCFAPSLCCSILKPAVSVFTA